MVWAREAVRSFKRPAGPIDPGDRRRILKGIVLVLPLLFVFTALFSSADPIFNRILNDILNLDLFRLLQYFPDWTVQAIFVDAYFTGLFTYVVVRKRDPSVPERPLPEYDPKRHVEINVMLTAILALFSIFVLSQLATMFGGEKVIQAGSTYADYAKGGFFQLTVVSAIVFAVSWFMDGYLYSHSRASDDATYRRLSAGVIGLTLVILVSAFRRLSLYEGAYGFTEDRFYGHVAIVLIGLSLCLLAYRTFRFVREGTFLIGIVAIFFSGLAVCNLINPEAFIASRNVSRSLTGEIHNPAEISSIKASRSLDYRYIAKRSADAVDVTFATYQSATPENREILAAELCALLFEIREKDDVREWNLARAHALELLSAHESRFDCQNSISIRSSDFVP